ncbi:hypothetical protein [Gemmatimonas sp.]|jgi:hypothetical protein|uniref:DUF7079 family protein n=1 Tax=Gemmatimonas sp. TaxID=1962908 RepID=UPI0037C044D1
MLPSLEGLTRRRPVWIVLSELWLDTELTDDDHRRIAAVLRVSGYTIPELEAICRSEVAPEVSGNLRSVRDRNFNRAGPLSVEQTARHSRARRTSPRDRGASGAPDARVGRGVGGRAWGA